MINYFKLMLGAKAVYAEECYKGNFIGIDFDIREDLKGKFPENWRDFNKKYIPVFLKAHPEAKKVVAGLACGTIWMVCNYYKTSDIVICPDGTGKYLVGEITGDYYYQKEGILPHRRPVKWYPDKIERNQMSSALAKSSGAMGTYCDITKYSEELVRLIGKQGMPPIIATDETIEDPSVFAMEKHLEDFLIQNWKNTEIGKHYDIYEDKGVLVGQQYPTDTGPIDILAISKDKKNLLVIELKRGRVSDNVLGQIQRYMGFVKDTLAENNQNVKGIIIGLEDDLKIQRALSVTHNIEFYRYQVSFKLFKG